MRTLPLALSLIVCPLAVAAEFIPGSDLVVGNWSGAAYTYDDGDWAGLFSHCVVNAPFRSGDKLYFSVSHDISVTMGVESRAITQPVGTLFPVTVYVDRIPPFYGDAEVVLNNFATLTFRDFSVAMDAFQRGQTLTVESLLGTRQFDLTDSFRALEAAKACASYYYGYRLSPGPASEDPLVATAPQTQTDPALLYQIATEMIAEMKVSDFRYLTQAELGEIGLGQSVFWESASLGVTGGVMLLPAPEGGNIRSTDGGDLAAMSESCAGEVATTSTDVSFTDFAARELRILCVEDAGSLETLITKVLVGQSVLYTILQFGDNGTGGGTVNRDAVSEEVAVRAASYVLEMQ